MADPSIVAIIMGLQAASQTGMRAEAPRAVMTSHRDKQQKTADQSRHKQNTRTAAAYRAKRKRRGHEHDRYQQERLGELALPVKPVADRRDARRFEHADEGRKFEERNRRRIGKAVLDLLQREIRLQTVCGCAARGGRRDFDGHIV